MITRIQGCMLEQQHNIPDCSVDLLLTDPPYNISDGGAKPDWIDPVTGENKNKIHSQRFAESFEQNWDAVSHDEFLSQLDSWSEMWSRKLRRGGSFAIFISDKYISYLWSSLEKYGLEPKRVITWKKPAAVPFNRGINPVSGCEFIVWGIKPGGRRTFRATIEEGTRVERHSIADKLSSILYRRIRESDTVPLNIEQILEESVSEMKQVVDSRRKSDNKIECVIPNTITYSGGSTKDRIHPTQKPEEVLKYLIELSSNPGDMILDTFAGSGSTGMAAWDLGRRCILIERDTKMFEKMNQRFVTLDNFE